MQKYYDILGVSKETPFEELKKKYRELSKKYHPDAHHNSPLRDLAEEKFKEINEAYDKIKNYIENGFSNEEYAQSSSYYESNPSESNKNDFFILNKKLTVYTEHLLYAEIDNLNSYVISQMKNYAYDVYNKSNNIDRMLKQGFDQVTSALLNTIDSYIKILLEYGYYTLNKSIIVNQYGDFLVGYLNELYNNFLEANYQIELENERATAERRYKKAVRGLNNRGSFRNIGSMLINSINKSSNKAGLYKSSELINGLEEGILYFYDNLLKFIFNSIGLSSKEDFLQTDKINALLNNFPYVKDFDKDKVLFEALEIHPFNPEIYKLILLNFGDNSGELERLGNIFDINVFYMKESILSNYEKNTINYTLTQYDELIKNIKNIGIRLGIGDSKNIYLKSLIEEKNNLLRKIEEERKFQEEQERLRKQAEIEAKIKSENENKAREIIKNLKLIKLNENSMEIVNLILLNLYREDYYENLLNIYGDSYNELVQLEPFVKIDFNKIKNKLITEKFRVLIANSNNNSEIIISELEIFTKHLGLENTEFINYLKKYPEVVINDERKKIELEEFKREKELELLREEEKKRKKIEATKKRDEFISSLIGLIFLVLIIYGIYYFISHKNHSNKASTETYSSESNTRHEENLNSSLLNFKEAVLQFKAGKYIIRIDKLDSGNYRYASFDAPKTISDEPNTVLESGYFDSSDSSFKFPFNSYVYVVVINNGVPTTLKVYKKNRNILEKSVETVDYVNTIPTQSDGNQPKSLKSIISSQLIPVNNLEIVKEKDNKSLVIVNKKSKDPAIVIVNNETEQLEFVQRGTLSKEIDLAIGDKNKDIHWIIKSVEVTGNICTETISAINMNLLSGTVVYSGNYPYIKNDKWLNYSRSYFSNIDMSSAMETFSNRKIDINEDGFTDIVISAKGLDDYDQVYDTEMTLYATENGFSM